MKKPLSTKSKFLKRDPVKYIRDKAKLDFHHFYSLTPLLDKWLQEKQKARPDHYTEEYIVIWRDEFIEDNWAELYNHTVTLCNPHHLQLHSVYGRNPALVTAKKQMRWVGIQRDKYGMV